MKGENYSNTSLADRVSAELLPRVERPAQYIGGEVNQLPRAGDWQRAEVRVALAFPDVYSIATSHVGLQVLYWLCNHTPGVCAERVYCPWTDAEQVLRDRNLPLFTLDTRQPVADADILGVSLQFELCFTNLLTMLDLAGIPLRSDDRTDAHPLVIAGGPQADNPEPVAEFLDLVVIGDGEPAMTAILEAVREYKQAGVPRREMILLMARRLPWIYAPNLYEPFYNADGTLAELRPRQAGLPARIARCHTTDFEHDPVPLRPIVPWIPPVHDRIAIEIMRGCPQVCRFCHAGYTKRPLKLRSVDRLLEIAESMYWATGHDEIALLSLSTGDYPQLRALAERMNERFAPRHVNLSLPSLRVDKMLASIPWLVSGVRKGSLTVAAEAARDDMRRAIRKRVVDVNLLDGVRAAYEAGWSRVKLYFMAGFPGEREEDIHGIWELARSVSDERRKLNKGPAAVSASVSWLVPKPFTPLQWMAQPRAEYFREVRDMLAAHARRKKTSVKLRTHGPEQSVLEAVLARGDRRLGPVIYAAWKSGARLEAWTEKFDARHWQVAYDKTGVDPDFYAHRERSFDEVLPWDHINLHMSRDFLQRGYDDVFVKLGAQKPKAGIVPAGVSGRSA